MWFHRKGNTIQGIAFDCGTSGVRAALFSFLQKDVLTKPDVSEIIRIPFAPAAYMDARQLKQKTREGIREVIKKLSSSFHPHEIMVGFSSPFYISKTIRVSHPRQDPRLPITNEESQALAAEAMRTFEEEAEKRIADRTVVTFTAMPLKTYVNGYRVSNPVGMAGKLLEASFRFEATKSNVFDDFKKLFAQHYERAAFRVASVALANFQALRAIYGNEQGFLIIDMGAEVTEIGLTIDGALEQVTSLPLGHMVFIREMAALLGISLVDASFIASRYAEQTLESGKAKQLGPLIAEFQDTWRKKLFTILTAYAQHHEIPTHVFFTGGGVLPFHKDIFLEDAFRPLFYGKNPMPELLAPDTLDHQFGKHMFQSPSDFALASLTLLGARTVV